MASIRDPPTDRPLSCGEFIAVRYTVLSTRQYSAKRTVEDQICGDIKMTTKALTTAVRD